MGGGAILQPNRLPSYSDLSKRISCIDILKESVRISHQDMYWFLGYPRKISCWISLQDILEDILVGCDANLGYIGLNKDRKGYVGISGRITKQDKLLG